MRDALHASARRHSRGDGGELRRGDADEPAGAVLPDPGDCARSARATGERGRVFSRRRVRHVGLRGSRPRSTAATTASARPASRWPRVCLPCASPNMASRSSRCGRDHRDRHDRWRARCVHAPHRIRARARAAMGSTRRRRSSCAIAGARRSAVRHRHRDQRRRRAVDARVCRTATGSLVLPVLRASGAACSRSPSFRVSASRRPLRAGRCPRSAFVRVLRGPTFFRVLRGPRSFARSPRPALSAAPRPVLHSGSNETLVERGAARDGCQHSVGADVDRELARWQDCDHGGAPDRRRPRVAGDARRLADPGRLAARDPPRRSIVRLRVDLRPHR